MKTCMEWEKGFSLLKKKVRGRKKGKGYRKTIRISESVTAVSENPLKRVTHWNVDDSPLVCCASSLIIIFIIIASTSDVELKRFACYEGKGRSNDAMILEYECWLYIRIC